MNAPTATLTPEAEVTAGDLAVLNEKTKIALLTDEKAFEDLLDKIRTEVRAHVPDLTTDKGRKAIASLAHKVTKTKTALDEAGKSLTEDLRKQVKTVDDSRRKIRENLDELRDEARKPLTDWEEAEEARAPTERFIDRFSRYYTPGVLVVGALVATMPPLLFGSGWNEWIYKGLAILLIGCPCALVISVPASIASAIWFGSSKLTVIMRR